KFTSGNNRVLTVNASINTLRIEGGAGGSIDLGAVAGNANTLAIVAGGVLFNDTNSAFEINRTTGTGSLTSNMNFFVADGSTLTISAPIGGIATINMAATGVAGTGKLV